MRKLSKFILSGMVIIGMTASQMAWAGYVPSTQAMTTQKTELSRSEIIQKLDMEAISNALTERGIDKNEVKERIALLSPTQVEQLKTQIDTIPSGEGAVGAIVGALLIVFFVLLFTDLLGETDAYDFDD